MNNLEERRSKINSCMAELFNLYMEDKKQIVASVEMDGVKCKLVFGEDSNVCKEQPKDTVSLEKVVIHCRTKNEALKCCSLADKLGFKWRDGDSFTEENMWRFYESNTCYLFEDGGFCDKPWYINEGYEVKSAQWFIDNFKIKE